MPSAIHITVPRQFRGRQDGVVIHRANLPDADRTRVEAVPVTSIARTLQDIAATSDPALVERLVAEGLDILHHPGIVFRDGPTGRRAALPVGPDVWEVISALRSTTGSPEQRVGMLAQQFDLHPRHIRTAIDYAAVHRDAAQRAARTAQAKRAGQHDNSDRRTASPTPQPDP